MFLWIKDAEYEIRLKGKDTDKDKFKDKVKNKYTDMVHCPEETINGNRWD